MIGAHRALQAHQDREDKKEPKDEEDKEEELETREIEASWDRQERAASKATWDLQA